MRWWNERNVCKVFEGGWISICKEKKLEHFSFAWQNVQRITYAAAVTAVVVVMVPVVVALNDEAKLGRNGFACTAIDFTLVKCDYVRVCSLCILYVDFIK